MSSKKILIVDDEPEYLRWLDDYIESKGFATEHVLSLKEALERVGIPGYELVIVDLNIPAAGTAIEAVANSGPVATRYPGLVVATRARTMGYGPRRVVAYTVHSDDAVEQELSRLGCPYVLKGRPHLLKAVIASTLRLE